MRFPTVAEWLGGILIARIAGRRPPDLIVGQDNAAGAYLLRWYITPWRCWAPASRVARFLIKLLPNLYLHKFLRDDDDRALHDHPSMAISFILRRGYVEHTIANGGVHVRTDHAPGSLRYLGLHHTHRIELHRDQWGNPEACWTLFWFGPRLRDWGFHCPQQGWVPWQRFTAAGKPGEIGPGCDA